MLAKNLVTMQGPVLGTRQRWETKAKEVKEKARGKVNVKIREKAKAKGKGKAKGTKGNVGTVGEWDTNRRNVGVLRNRSKQWKGKCKWRSVQYGISVLWRLKRK